MTSVDNHLVLRVVESEPRGFAPASDPATGSDGGANRGLAGALGEEELRPTNAPIGHATSPDLVEGEDPGEALAQRRAGGTTACRPPRAVPTCAHGSSAPLSEPAGFGQLEVPPVRLVEGRPLLVLTGHPDEQTAAGKERSGRYCTWSVAGQSLTGPWDIDAAGPFESEPRTTDFEIVDPVPVTLENGTRTKRPDPQRGARVVLNQACQVPDGGLAWPACWRRPLAC